MKTKKNRDYNIALESFIQKSVPFGMGTVKNDVIDILYPAENAKECLLFFSAENAMEECGKMASELEKEFSLKGIKLMDELDILAKDEYLFLLR